MIYLDNGATTPLDPLVLEAMRPYLTEYFGNASSLHRLGAESARAVRQARETIANALGVEAETVVFTGGGTEADNLGIRGTALAASKRRRHALLFELEHPAVWNQREFLEQLGYTVETIPSNTEGLCNPDDVERLLRPNDTALVAVMHANNEIGTVQPIAEIGELIADLCPKASFHVDAVQSFTKVPVRPRSMGVTTLALAAHKIHGPKGVGCLYIAPKSRVRAQAAGGGQERKLRPGTENVAGIVGFAAAVRLALETHQEDVRRMTALRDTLIEQVVARVERVSLNGSREHRLCNNANFNFHGARAEILLHALEERGIYVSSGSACHAGQTGPSHVLRAIGHTDADEGSLRITLSRFTTQDHIDTCIEALSQVVDRARA